MRKKTVEDYIELIYTLQKKNVRVHTNDIASKLNINPSSVTEMLQKLGEEGYIDYQKYNGSILEKKGKELAKKINKKHTTLMEFLILLGVDKKTAEIDACEMEHILHPETMDAVIKFLEVVKKCGATPYWLNRLKEYISTGKLSKCPPELQEICKKYS